MPTLFYNSAVCVKNILKFFILFRYLFFKKMIMAYKWKNSPHTYYLLLDKMLQKIAFFLLNLHQKKHTK